MGKEKPTSALSAEQINALADSLELDPKKTSLEQISGLRSQLLGSGKAINQLIEAEKAAGKLMRLRALFFLLAEHPSHLKRRPIATYRQVLIRAAEWTLLRISQDPRYSEKTRRRLGPAPIYAGSGLVHALHCPPLAKLAACKSTEDVDALELRRSSVYKPKEQSAGGTDCPVRFVARPADWGPYWKQWQEAHGKDSDPEFPRRLELVRTKQGWRLHALQAAGPATQPINDEIYPSEKIPSKVEIGGLTYRAVQRARHNILPGEEMLAEVLYYRLCSHLEDVARTIPNFPLKTFACPATSIEAYSHPSFGAHHALGSRQDYVTKGLSSLLWAQRVTEANPKITDPLQQLPVDELLKVVIPDLISGNLDRNFSNLMIVGDVIHPIDAGSSFPHFAGETAILSEVIQQDWSTLQQFSKPLAAHWVQLVNAIDPNTLVAQLREEVSWLSKRFPKESLQLATSQEIIIYSAVSFLKAFVKKSAWPAYKLTTYYRHVPLRDLSGQLLDLNQDGPVTVGGEFWSTIDVVCMKEKFNYLEQQEIPHKVKERLDKAYMRLIKREEMLRNFSDYMREERRRYSPAIFVRWILEGRYDELFPKRPSATKKPVKKKKKKPKAT